MVPLLALGLACAAPEIRERCRFITEHVRQPPMPPGFAELDRALLRHAIEATVAVRGMKSWITFEYRRGFAEQFLPLLCERMERARALATAGQVREEGVTYQGLTVASQVLQLDVAMFQMAEYANAAGQPVGQIDATLKTFASRMAPLLEAALSNGKLVPRGGQQ